MSLPVVLLYHAVAPLPPGATAFQRQFFVRPQAFEAQMADLASQGYRTLRLDEFAAAIRGVPAPARSALVTFDDAYAHVHALATPILRRHGFTAVTFAPWAHLGGVSDWDSAAASPARLDLATPELLRAMVSDGWEIASHGFTHTDLRAMPQARRVHELTIAREALSAVADAPVVDLAYPYGHQDSAVRGDVARAGYRMAFVATPGPSSDPLRLSRRPISGDDSIAAFRLKTMAWSRGLYRVHRFTPSWARSAARNLLKVTR